MQESEIYYALKSLQVNYWYEVDHNCGRNAAAFYTKDGLFAVGDQRMKGTAEVQAFYTWRERRGVRTARHVVTNCRVTQCSSGRAVFQCVMLLYAGDGLPVLPSQPPVMISDILDECVLQHGKWLFQSHVLTPIFAGGVGATIPTPDQIAQYTAGEGRRSEQCD